MNWWQYKGDAKNLFGPPTESAVVSLNSFFSSQSGTITKSKKSDKKSDEKCVNLKNADEKIQKAQIQNLNEKLDQWISVLNAPNTVSALMNTLEVSILM
jgi:hypothetical protein